MSDYFTKFEAELRRAAARLTAAEPRAPRRAFRWRSRGTLLVGIALIAAAVPALAAVTGTFDNTRAPTHLAPGSSASLAPPCRGPSPPPLQPQAGHAPAALTALMATLRRPQLPKDKLTGIPLPASGPVFMDAVRLAYKTANGAAYYLVPMASIPFRLRVPNTPECAALRRAMRHARSEPGVCVWRVGGPASGGGCATLSQLQRNGASGPAQQGYSAGMKPGTMYVSGIAADGVSAVILRYSNRAPVRDVRIPVRANVYAAVVRGRPELAPAVYAQTREGIRLVQRGQQPTSRRQRALNRRSKHRDLSATSRPSVVPPVGHPHTTFTFRVRLQPLHGYVYVVRVTGPPGLCHETVKPFAVNPARSGPLRGLIKLGIGYGLLGLHKMCLGRYRGTIAIVRNGAPIVGGSVVKRFGFAVAPRPAGG